MNDDTLDDDGLWLDADLDGELDPARSLALARRLEREPALREAYEARRALRDAVRAQATRHAAPAALRARPERPFAAASAPPAPPGRRARPVVSWLAGAAFGAVAASLATWGVVERSGVRSEVPAGERAQADAASEAVSAHTRALLVGQPIEVASADQHTVRPWLSARLNFVPPIVDLAPQGFALVGARRDVVAGEVAATLVYRHGAHLVSVFVAPLPAAEAGAERAPALRVVRGFNVLEMAHASMAWRLVSDMNAAEMQAFARLLRENA